MHFFQYGDAPPELEDLKKASSKDSDGYHKWEPQKHPEAYSRFMRRLQRLVKICSYCERQCNNKEFSIDHFKPKSEFKSETYNWDNLVYSCEECNDVKGNKFPGVVEFRKDVEAARAFAKRHGRPYIPPSEFVNPRNGTDKAERFFAFTEEGKIIPNPELADDEWSKALRTIVDLKLWEEGGPRKSQINVLRGQQLFMVYATYRIMKRIDKFLHPQSEFSSIVRFAKRNRWLDEPSENFDKIIKQNKELL